MNDIYDLIGRKEYNEKMLHSVPQVPVVERELYLLQKAKEKVVLDIGASGPMHEAIKHAAQKCYGLDIVSSNEADYYQVDIDKADWLPAFPDVELVIAGEIIEHLDNAGHFLDLLKQYTCPIIITAPNAFCDISHRSILTGVENVNPGHVAYYSYWTLSTLLGKHGYQVIEWFWYHGKPFTAEGMIFRVERHNGIS